MNRPLSVLTLAALCFAGASLRGGAAAPGLSAIQLRVDRLAALTDRVEALSAIKRLQHAYGHYSELGLWHDFADLFADTGVGYYTQGALDREGVRALFVKEVGQGRVGLADGRIYPHISMQPVVTLAADGQSAHARWHIMAMLGGYGTSASWAGGVYENQYVRERGVWKVQEVRYVQQYSGRYENPGWTAAREPAPRFEASRAGQPILPVDVGAAFRRPEDATLATVAQRTAELAARARRLGDEIEVTNLQHAYGYYVDQKMWDDVADLFASDATMEIGLQGVYVGRRSIRRGLGAAGLADGEINDHVHLQTIVSVAPDGRTARARGGDVSMTGTTGGKALWSQSIYENQFVKQSGVWKFKAVRVYPRFSVDAGQGWAKDAQPAPGPSRAFPPDRPPTETYAIYPRFYSAPVHFAHPVMGRQPATVRTVGAVKTAAALEVLLTATERSVERSRAYHAVENLSNAHGYSIEESAPPNALTIHQVVQPVIHVSADGRSAKIRARLWQLGNSAGGEGVWVSGIYEQTAALGSTAPGSTAAEEGGIWKLSSTNLHHMWTAPSRGGWAGAKAAPAVPFHYRNPVSNRVPPVLLP
jgi:hypothetical protein